MGATMITTDYRMGFHRAMSVAATSATQCQQLDDCGACRLCRDTCSNVESCITCQEKLNALHAQCGGPETNWFMGAFSIICPKKESQTDGQSKTYTPCQVRRHNHANSAWITVGDTIYDATPYIKSHPGGIVAILKKSGGAVDCMDDLRFHSKRAQKEWKKFKVGTLVSCCNARKDEER